MSNASTPFDPTPDPSAQPTQPPAAQGEQEVWFNDEPAAETGATPAAGTPVVPVEGIEASGPDATWLMDESAEVGAPSASMEGASEVVDGAAETSYVEPETVGNLVTRALVPGALVLVASFAAVGGFAFIQKNTKAEPADDVAAIDQSPDAKPVGGRVELMRPDGARSEPQSRASVGRYASAPAGAQPTVAQPAEPGELPPTESVEMAEVRNEATEIEDAPAVEAMGVAEGEDVMMASVGVDAGSIQVESTSESHSNPEEEAIPEAETMDESESTELVEVDPPVATEGEEAGTEEWESASDDFDEWGTEAWDESELVEWEASEEAPNWADEPSIQEPVPTPEVVAAADPTAEPEPFEWLLGPSEEAEFATPGVATTEVEAITGDALEPLAMAPTEESMSEGSSTEEPSIEESGAAELPETDADPFSSELDELLASLDGFEVEAEELEPGAWTPTESAEVEPEFSEITQVEQESVAESPVESEASEEVAAEFESPSAEELLVDATEGAPEAHETIDEPSAPEPFSDELFDELLADLTAPAAQPSEVQEVQIAPEATEPETLVVDPATIAAIEGPDLDPIADPFESTETLEPLEVADPVEVFEALETELEAWSSTVEVAEAPEPIESPVDVEESEAIEFGYGDWEDLIVVTRDESVAAETPSETITDETNTDETNTDETNTEAPELQPSEAIEQALAGEEAMEGPVPELSPLDFMGDVAAADETLVEPSGPDAPEKIDTESDPYLDWILSEISSDSQQVGDAMTVDEPLAVAQPDVNVAEEPATAPEAIASVPAEEVETLEPIAVVEDEGPKSILRRVDTDAMWMGRDVPLRLVSDASVRLTPNAGNSRIVFKGGEIFEGRLHQVGGGKVVLDTRIGRMSLDGARVAAIQALGASSLAKPSAIEKDTTGLEEVQVRAAGGIFVGHLVSQEGDRVTLLMPEGYRMALRALEVKPLRGIRAQTILNRKPGEQK